jgi:hypothetical protein
MGMCMFRLLPEGAYSETAPALRQGTHSQESTTWLGVMCVTGCSTRSFGLAALDPAACARYRMAHGTWQSRAR